MKPIDILGRVNLIRLSMWAIVAIAATASGQATNGLVAYWAFDGDTRDRSGQNHDATIFGAHLTSDRFDRPDSACLFDGKLDYLDVASPFSLQLTNEITISAWINCSGGGPWNPRLVSFGAYYPADCHGFEFLTVGSGSTRKMMFIFGTAEMQSINTVPENSWHFVAVTGTRESMAIYIDGALDSSINAAPGGFNFADSPLFIGAKAPGGMTPGDDNWGGKIDELRIYSRALSQAEMAQLYWVDSAPALTVAQMGEGRIQLNASRLITGANYELQYSTDLKSWEIWQTPITADSFSGIQMSVLSGNECTFWRLVPLWK